MLISFVLPGSIITPIHFYSSGKKEEETMGDKSPKDKEKKKKRKDKKPAAA
ncbi:MAG TPA: hypothetical protein VF338_05825 [Leptolinea sp.]